MNLVPFLGLAAATLTTTAQLPQLIKILRLKETRDISLIAYLILNAGIILWLIYGIIINDPPLYLANSITVVITLSILYTKIKYG